MRYTYISTIIEYDLLEEIFRLLNSLKSFIFISTTKRIKNDFEKKTLLLYMHIYTHTLHLYRINFSNTEKKKKGGIKKHSHTNKWRTLFQLNKYFTRDKSKHEWGAILAHELEITVQNPANFLFQSATIFSPPRPPRVKSAGNRDRVNAIAIEQNSCSNAGIRVPPLTSVRSLRGDKTSDGNGVGKYSGAGIKCQGGGALAIRATANNVFP